MIDPDLIDWQPVWMSLRVALVAVLVDLPLAVGAAWLVARHRFWGRSLLEGLCHLPLVLPPVVVGLVLLYLFGRNGPLGRVLADGLGLQVSFHWTGAALAAAVMAFPLMMRAIRTGIEQLDPELEEAARVLGASPFQVFLRHALPLLVPSVLAGCVLGYGRALGEFGATIMIAGNLSGDTRTIATAIYTYANFPDQEVQLWTMVALSVCLAFAAFLVADWLGRQSPVSRNGRRR